MLTTDPFSQKEKSLFSARAQVVKHFISFVGSESSQVWRVCNAEVCGTPGYLAPEIIACSMDAGHAGYGAAVDMWVCRQKPRDAVERKPMYKCSSNVKTIFNSLYTVYCVCKLVYNMKTHTLWVWFSSGSCLQMEFRGDHVHAACRLSALLAQETDADATYDLGRELRLLISRMGRPLRHR